MADRQQEPDNSSKPSLRDEFAETALEESPDVEYRKLSVNEALELLDKMCFSTDGDSTEIIRELRDAR